MIAGIDKKELAILKFTVDEAQTKLCWEHSKEFEYDGEMYDVVETQVTRDSVLYWCWRDHEETRLNKQLDDLVAQALGNNRQHKENQEKLIDFCKSLYCSKAQVMNVSLDSKTVIFFSPCTVSCISCLDTPPVPPPEIV